VALPSEERLVLFIGGEPGPALPSLHSNQLSFFARAAGAYSPPILMMGTHEPAPPQGSGAAADPNAWHFSPETIDCANLVIDLAQRAEKQLTIVDVDHSGADEGLVGRWVRPTDLLPVLVRPDGARLSGPEYFTPARVRQFIAGR
jgi:hypothetical protein